MKIPNLRAKFKPKRCKGNLHFGKVFLLIILIILCSFSLATAEKITEEIVVYKYNEGYYSDYNSAYEDINSLFKTEYPEGEEYFIAKKVDGEWKLFDGFGERMLFKIEPIVKEISKGKFVNGYKFSCKKPIKTSSFSTMSLQSSGSGWYEVARAELDPSESDRESGNCYVDYKGDEVSGVQKIKSVYNDEIVYTMRTKWIQKKPNAIYRARIDYKDTGRERLRIILILEERINNSSPTITISRPGENSYFV